MQQTQGLNKKILGSGHNTTTLTISNDEMEDIIEIAKSLEDSGVLLKGASETIQNEAKEQKGGFLSMLLDALDASLLGSILAGKGVIRAGDRVITKRQVQGIIRAVYGNKKDF